MAVETTACHHQAQAWIAFRQADEDPVLLDVVGGWKPFMLTVADPVYCFYSDRFFFLCFTFLSCDFHDRVSLSRSHGWNCSFRKGMASKSQYERVCIEIRQVLTERRSSTLPPFAVVLMVMVFSTA